MTARFKNMKPLACMLLLMMNVMKVHLFVHSFVRSFIHYYLFISFVGSFNVLYCIVCMITHMLHVQHSQSFTCAEANRYNIILDNVLDFLFYWVIHACFHMCETPYSLVYIVCCMP